MLYIFPLEAKTFRNGSLFLSPQHNLFWILFEEKKESKKSCVGVLIVEVW